MGVEVFNRATDEQAMVNGRDGHVFQNSDKMPVFEKPESWLPSTSSEEDFIQYNASELRNSVTGNGHVNRNNSKLPLDAQLASGMHAPGGETARPNTFSSCEVGNACEMCSPLLGKATWIRYPNTTGLPTVDYRFTDSLTDPPDTRQKHVEELVCLPECFLFYTPSPKAGPVSPTPGITNSFVTFGSFNNLAKITPNVLRVWARILLAIPNFWLVVKCKPFCCDSVRQRFLSTLRQLGLESLRVDLLPLILLNHSHMQAYSLMDNRPWRKFDREFIM